MWAVDKVAEEGAAEIAAGMETSQNKVWTLWRAGSLLTDVIVGRGAPQRRRVFLQVSTLTAIGGQHVEPIL